MIKKLAQLISIFFHPLLLPTYLFAVVFYFLPEVAGTAQRSLQGYLLLAIFITTFAIPLLSLVLLKMTANIADLQMQERSDRIMPFFFITIFYGVSTYLFMDKLNVGWTFGILLGGISLILLGLSIITLFVKISAHAAAISGSTGFLLALLYLYQVEGLFFCSLAAILISGIVMSSRLYLQAHTLKEIGLGVLLGLSISLFSILIL